MLLPIYSNTFITRFVIMNLLCFKSIEQTLSLIAGMSFNWHICFMHRVHTFIIKDNKSQFKNNIIPKY